MPLLDLLFGKTEDAFKLKDVPDISDARIAAIGESSIALRVPDTSKQGFVRAATSEAAFGKVPVDAKTKPTQLHFKEAFKRDKNGNLEIDFTQFGGQKFNGTVEDLSALQGAELADVIGISVFDNATGNTLSNSAVQGKNLVGTAPTAPSPVNSVKPVTTNAPRPKTLASPAKAPEPIKGLSLEDFDAQVGGLSLTEKSSLIQRILASGSN